MAFFKDLDLDFTRNPFSSDLTTRLSSTYTAEEIEEMPIGEYIKFAKDWIQEFKY